MLTITLDFDGIAVEAEVVMPPARQLGSLTIVNCRLLEDAPTGDCPRGTLIKAAWEGKNKNPSWLPVTAPVEQ